MSVFLVWHTVVMVVSPLPSSALKSRITPWLKPYQILFYQEARWDFFSPHPATGPAVRYQVEDESGGSHLFKLTEALKRSSPCFLRYVKLYSELFKGKPPCYAESAAQYLCRRHAALKPVRVKFILLFPRVPPFRFYRENEAPSEKDLFRVETLPAIPCESHRG